MNLDSRNLKRAVLTAEQRSGNCYSRPSVKIIRKSDRNLDVSVKFRGPTTSISEIVYYQALEKLAKTASEWMTWKKLLTQKRGSEALMALTDSFQILTASLRSILNSVTLRFISHVPKLRTRRPGFFLIIYCFQILLK